jgi:hypothetical protein
VTRIRAAVSRTISGEPPKNGGILSHLTSETGLVSPSSHTRRDGWDGVLN